MKTVPVFLRSCLVFCLLSCFFVGSTATARTPFQVRCEDDLGKTVSLLTARQSGYSLNHALSYKDLTQMKQPGRANTVVLGLTKTQSRIEIGLAGAILQDAASGHECVAPHITVRLFYDPIVIYVGREFPQDSCAYGQILAHELRHMKVYLDHLPVVETVVRAALAHRFKARPLYAPSGTARLALAHEVNTGWLPYIKAEMAKVELQQAQIDSVQEYARLKASCNGEINSIVGPPRGR